MRKKLLKAVENDIDGKPVNARALEWARLAITRILPQVVEGQGEGGAIVFKVINYE